MHVLLIALLALALPAAAPADTVQQVASELRSLCQADMRGIKSPLAGLRFHDLRHLAITELAESQVSDQTIMAIAGHVSQKMLARYSHVRTEARRQAVAALSARPTGE